MIMYFVTPVCDYYLIAAAAQNIIKSYNITRRILFAYNFQWECFINLPFMYLYYMQPSRSQREVNLITCKFSRIGIMLNSWWKSRFIAQLLKFKSWEIKMKRLV